MEKQKLVIGTAKSEGQLEREVTVASWLLSVGLGQYVDIFEAHSIGIDALPFIKDGQLKEMGVAVVGDRLKIMGEAQILIRGVKNARRQEPIISFIEWQWIQCCTCWAPRFTISESAIEVTTINPLTCYSKVDNVDISSVTDIQLTTWLNFLGYIEIANTDPSQGGLIKVRLSLGKARMAFKTIKQVWEADQLRLGRLGGKSEGLL